MWNLRKRNLIANGNHVFVQGDVFYPGAESIAPVRGILPIDVITGVGYIPYDHVPVIGESQFTANQTAAPIGLGVQLGQFINLTPLQDNSISQES